MAKQQRQVFHSILTKKEGWVVLLDQQVLSKHANQKEAEEAATAEGRAAYEADGLGQAVLHESDGTIREERTYRKDPEKTPG